MRRDNRKRWVAQPCDAI
ncbi:MAG: hypothetical protein IKD05_06615 [Tidjanibacter sp.]|nr:hypothetical protein [Tidjanibacter sp.]MBR3853812.1 hypothetical protein [Tidjanibacter sp.]MBR7129928.1 hypothetical protein [Tidjanibacter sp.]